MWNVTPTDLWNWSELKEKIKKYGVRNSLLLAPMPTASTAQILGNNESFEPYTSNIYSRRVLSGEFQVSVSTSLDHEFHKFFARRIILIRRFFQVVNHHLLRDLVERELWDEDLKNELIMNSGSVQVFNYLF